MARLFGKAVEGMLSSIMVEALSFVELDIIPLGVLYSVERIIQIVHLLYTVVLFQYLN